MRRKSNLFLVSLGLLLTSCSFVSSSKKISIIGHWSNFNQIRPLLSFYEDSTCHFANCPKYPFYTKNNMIVCDSMDIMMHHALIKVKLEVLNYTDSTLNCNITYIHDLDKKGNPMVVPRQLKRK